MNKQEELVLQILSSVKEIKGKTKFMKMLHLVCKFIEKKKKETPFNFENNQYGVFTPQLDPVLEKLSSQNDIKISSPFLSKRQDFSLINKERLAYAYPEFHLEIKNLVQSLNEYSADEIVAISYYFFPDTTTNSKIKPEINRTIIELFSPLSSEFEESIEEKIAPEPIASESRPLYPQFNDMDMRMHMMKSLGLKKLPEINPNAIDESTGIIAKNTSFFKKYDLEKLLEDARKR